MNTINEVAENNSCNPQAALARQQFREAMVKEHMNLVRTIAVSVGRHINHNVEEEELMAWGATGLLHAVDRYREDNARKASFVTYAYYRIRGAMLDSLGKSGPMTRGEYRRACIENDRSAFFLDSREADLIPNLDEPTAEEKLHKRDMFMILANAMDKLSPAAKSLLEARYFSNSTLKDAGGDLGKSKSWACRVHRKALENLRQEILDSELGEEMQVSYS